MTAGTGPWRVLLLDREPDDGKWIMATVKRADHVRPATLDEVGRYSGWPEICGWVRSRLGGMPASLTPVPEPLAWRIDLGGPR